MITVVYRPYEDDKANINKFSEHLTTVIDAGKGMQYMISIAEWVKRVNYTTR